MSPELAADILQSAIILVIKIVCVLAIPSLLTGLCISILQAATQINEQSLSTLPRLIITLLTFTVTSPWLIIEFNDYFIGLMNRVPFIISTT